jgi:hypothetical protein
VFHSFCKDLQVIVMFNSFRKDLQVLVTEILLYTHAWVWMYKIHSRYCNAI